LLFIIGLFEEKFIFVSKRWWRHLLVLFSASSIPLFYFRNKVVVKSGNLLEVLKKYCQKIQRNNNAISCW